MQHTRTSFFVGLVLCASCALFEPQSKIRAGEAFTTGQAQYDDYFGKVHTLQLAAASWADQKKATRRNLIDALKIATDAPDVTIVEATHERMVAAAHIVGSTHLELREDEGKLVVAAEGRADGPTQDFLKAVRATIDGEMKRKRDMQDVPQKCDDLAKAGRDLEPHVKDDFFRQGGTMMADVHDEIEASFDVLGQLSKTARIEKRETEDFVADLARAVEASPGEPIHTTVIAPTTTTSHPASHPKPPPVAETAPVAPKPKPKPKPQPAGGGGDDFNP
ncbi:MAG TPA: hypothetical protein VGH28_27905 [Polyangiaceae bacterium]|jgi:hypothetical protein